MRKSIAAACVVVVGVLYAVLSNDPPTVRAAGSVIRTDGASLVKAGTPCSVTVEANRRGGCNCRVTIVCGAEHLYGGQRLGGWADCDVEDDHFVTAIDEYLAWKDGDPWLDLDVVAGQAIIRSDRPAQQVVVAFKPQALVALE